MLKRSHLLLMVLVLTALVFTLLKIPVASSQGLTVTAGYLEGDLPVSDPNSELWQNSRPVEVPLSAQSVSKPLLLDSKVKSVSTRALHNGSEIVILVEWLDESKDESTVRIQDFRDSVALQFPLVETQPFFCMGQQGGNVNIWHWKADWQADILARQDIETVYPNTQVDYYPYAETGEERTGSGKIASVTDYTDENYLSAVASGNILASIQRNTPVEDLVAGGFGSLDTQSFEEQNVLGFGEWVDGKWRVIFSRELNPDENGDISFAAGKTYFVAYAVWDGSNNERNGQKSTSQWVSFKLASEPSVSKPAEEASVEQSGWLSQQGWLMQNLLWIMAAALGLFFLAVIVIYFKLPEE